jgi:hypothetical protein
MRNLLRSTVTAILVLGIALAIWKMTGGDVGGFFDGLGSLLFTIISSVATFFGNLFGMFVEK